MRIARWTCKIGPGVDMLTHTHVQATNVDFANRLYNSSEVSGSKRFSKPKLSQTGFAIEHYAGGVGYKTDNFLIKNKDFVVAEHQQLMQNSDQPFVRMLFPAEPEAPAADGNKVRILLKHYVLCTANGAALSDRRAQYIFSLTAPSSYC